MSFVFKNLVDNFGPVLYLVAGSVFPNQKT